MLVVCLEVLQQSRGLRESSTNVVSIRLEITQQRYIVRAAMQPGYDLIRRPVLFVALPSIGESKANGYRRESHDGRDRCICCVA